MKHTVLERTGDRPLHHNLSDAHSCKKTYIFDPVFFEETLPCSPRLLRKSAA